MKRYRRRGYVKVTINLKEHVLEKIDELAEEYGVTRSDIIRLLLALGVRFMLRDAEEILRELRKREHRSIIKRVVVV